MSRSSTPLIPSPTLIVKIEAVCLDCVWKTDVDVSYAGAYGRQYIISVVRIQGTEHVMSTVGGAYLKPHTVEVRVDGLEIARIAPLLPPNKEK